MDWPDFLMKYIVIGKDNSFFELNAVSNQVHFDRRSRNREIVSPPPLHP
jgi:hypothetical protein